MQTDAAQPDLARVLLRRALADCSLTDAIFRGTQTPPMPVLRAVVFHRAFLLAPAYGVTQKRIAEAAGWDENTARYLAMQVGVALGERSPYTRERKRLEGRAKAERDAEMLAMREAGLRSGEVARALGVKSSTVRTAWRKGVAA